MSSETKTPIFSGDKHPDENQILLALERELPPDEASQVEQHLGNCWSCRARAEEIERGILAFVEYREKRYLPALEQPPRDYSGFRGRLRTMVGESQAPGLLRTIWQSISDFFSLHSQIRWVSVVAAGMAVVVFWTQVVNPPVVSATELISRAISAQNSSDGAQSRVGRVAHQRVQIHVGGRTVVRNFQWVVGDPAMQTRWNIPSNHLDWNTPLTAVAFAQWRDSLRSKKDQVKRSGGLLTIDTRGSGVLQEARMTVRARDFHPLEQHLWFSDDTRLDLVEIAFQIDEEKPKSPAPAAPVPATLSKKTERLPPPAPVDLDDVELQLRYTLFTHRWDLGEDLVIARGSGRVALSGTVSSIEREKAMRSVLNRFPNLELAIHGPSGSEITAPGFHRSQASIGQTRTLTPLLADTLANTFASREDRLVFVDKCLATSDTELSHAWALRLLVDRYSAAEESRLSRESKKKLYEMLATHLRELRRADRDLNALIELLPASPPYPPTNSLGWRAGVLALFHQVQRQDELIASLVVGAQTGNESVTDTSSNFQASHQAINALLHSLNDLTAASSQ